jgi:hypothetical protein
MTGRRQGPASGVGQAGPGRARSRADWMVRGLAAAVAAVVGLSVAALPSQAAAHGWHLAQVGFSSSSAGLSGVAGPVGSYVVRAVPGHLGELVAELRAGGVTLGRQVVTIDAVVARLPAAAAQGLRAAPLVASVTADEPVQMLASSYSPGSDPNSWYASQKATSVRSRAWSAGGRPGLGWMWRESTPG